MLPTHNWKHRTRIVIQIKSFSRSLPFHAHQGCIGKRRSRALDVAYCNGGQMLVGENGSECGVACHLSLSLDHVEMMMANPHWTPTLARWQRSYASNLFRTGGQELWDDYGCLMQPVWQCEYTLRSMQYTLVQSSTIDQPASQPCLILYEQTSENFVLEIVPPPQDSFPSLLFPLFISPFFVLLKSLTGKKSRISKKKKKGNKQDAVLHWKMWNFPEPKRTFASPKIGTNFFQVLPSFPTKFPVENCRIFVHFGCLCLSLLACSKCLFDQIWSSFACLASLNLCSLLTDCWNSLVMLTDLLTDKLATKRNKLSFCWHSWTPSSRCCWTEAEMGKGKNLFQNELVSCNPEKKTMKTVQKQVNSHSKRDFFFKKSTQNTETRQIFSS